MVCPSCKKAFVSEGAKSPHRPFCSERCRLADLGAWLDGSHRISSPISEEDLDEGVDLQAVEPTLPKGAKPRRGD